MTIDLPQEYGYVLATALTSCLVRFWHGMRIHSFRGPAGISYPQHYASPEQIAAASSPSQAKALYLFNCAQRAHGNYMENHIVMLGFMMVGGLKYPVASAALGSIWIVGRIMYAVGYTDPNKEKGQGRLMGLLQYVGLVGLLGTGFMTTRQVLGF